MLLLIELTGVSKVYQSKDSVVHALRDIDLEVKKGEIFGIIGQSGAGKSTLLRCVNLLARPDSGSVTVGGVEMTGLSARNCRPARKKIGMIFQHFNLLSTATARDNIAFPLRPGGLSDRRIRRRADELLELVGMRRMRTNIRRSCPADRSSASASRGRWPAIRTCCSATRRLRRSISRRPVPSWAAAGHQPQAGRHHSARHPRDRSHPRDLRPGSGHATGTDRGVGPDGGSAAQARHPATRELLRQTEDPDGGDASGSDPGGTIIRVLYSGDSAGKPALSEAVRGTSVQFVILHGTVSRIRDVPYGRLTIRLTGPSERDGVGDRQAAGAGMGGGNTRCPMTKFRGRASGKRRARRSSCSARSLALSVPIGLVIGVLVFLTSPGQFWQQIWVIPAAVVDRQRHPVGAVRHHDDLCHADYPLARRHSIGVKGAIPPLVIAAAPFFARMTEIALREVDRGVIEAAEAMGTPRLLIIWRVLLREARTGLIAGVTVTAVNLVSYTAMSGVIGGGGLGDGHPLRLPRL